MKMKEWRAGIRHLCHLAGSTAWALALVLLVLAQAAADDERGRTIPAFANGERVLTVTTEASDAATAEALEVTLSPPLAGAIGLGATSARYHVTNFSQD